MLLNEAIQQKEIIYNTKIRSFVLKAQVEVSKRHNVNSYCNIINTLGIIENRKTQQFKAVFDE